MAQTAAQRKSQEKYRKSPKGQATRKKYLKSPKGKAAQKRAQDNYKRNHPEKIKASSEKSKLAKYGIDRARYQLMFAEQKGVCKLCGKPEKKIRKLAVDHCHTTGKVRGLLCMECNTGLGKFKDNTEVLARAIAYLEVHRQPVAA